MPKVVTLTDTQVRNARPKAKEYNLAAGKGLQLRIYPSGSKLWLFNYVRPRTDKRTNVSIGGYPDWSLKKATTERDKYREWLTSGLDPKVERGRQEVEEREQEATVFEAVYREWLELKTATVSPSYLERITDAMDLHVLPSIGETPVYKLTAPEVIDVLRPLEKRNRLETVRKLCRWINEVMDYAVNGGKLKANPLSKIRKVFQPPKTTHHPTIKPKELPQFMRDLEQASITIETRCLIEWLLHTMARPGEGASTEWTEIDFEKATWTVPAEKMKMSRDHVVLLTPQALSILQVMKPLTGHRRYVFTSYKDPKAHVNPETPNMALKRMGYGGRLVAHGIRAIGSTALNEHGHDAELVEVSLSHVDKDSIRAAYNRAEYLERRRAIMVWWSNSIEEAATGRKINEPEEEECLESR